MWRKQSKEKAPSAAGPAGAGHAGEEKQSGCRGCLALLLRFFVLFILGIVIFLVGACLLILGGESEEESAQVQSTAEETTTRVDRPEDYYEVNYDGSYGYYATTNKYGLQGFYLAPEYYKRKSKYDNEDGLGKLSWRGEEDLAYDRLKMADKRLAEALKEESKNWVEVGSPLPPSGAWTKAEIVHLYRSMGRPDLAEEAKLYASEFIRDRGLKVAEGMSPEEMAARFANWDRDIKKRVEKYQKDNYKNSSWNNGTYIWRLYEEAGYWELADQLRKGDESVYKDFIPGQCVRVVEFDSPEEMRARFERWESEDEARKTREREAGFVDYGYAPAEEPEEEENNPRRWTKRRIVDLYDMAGRPDLAELARAYPEEFLKKECLWIVEFKSLEDLKKLHAVWSERQFKQS